MRGEDDQLTLDNCPSSSLDAATTYNTDPSHDSTIDNHDSTPPVPSAITAPPPNHTDRDARTTRDSPPIRSTSTRPSPRHTDRDARTPRERMAECRVSPGKTHVLIGDSVFGQIEGWPLELRNSKILGFLFFYVYGLIVACTLSLYQVIL